VLSLSVKQKNKNLKKKKSLISSITTVTEKY